MPTIMLDHRPKVTQVCDVHVDKDGLIFTKDNNGSLFAQGPSPANLRPVHIHRHPASVHDQAMQEIAKRPIQGVRLLQIEEMTGAWHDLQA